MPNGLSIACYSRSSHNRRKDSIQRRNQDSRRARAVVSLELKTCDPQKEFVWAGLEATWIAKLSKKANAPDNKRTWPKQSRKANRSWRSKSTCKYVVAVLVQCAQHSWQNIWRSTKHKALCSHEVRQDITAARQSYAVMLLQSVTNQQPTADHKTPKARW